MLQTARVLSGFALIALLICNAFAADNCLFNYQGRVLVQGYPYTGDGQMKVAVLATTGTQTITLWSNDGSSVAGVEPAASFPVTVTSGVFDILVGDTTAGMQALPAIMFNREDELKVRVWFDDGLHGFQQLSPDRRLTNPRRLGLVRITMPTVLYVNSAEGNNSNSGLSSAAPKKTVQAALDMLPKSIYANTTVTLAAGAYAPFVIRGFTDCKSPLTIIGDPVNKPTESQVLNVTIDGRGGNAVEITQSGNILLEGISTTNSYGGFMADFCANPIIFRRCKATNSYAGFFVQHNSYATIEKCVASSNGRGFEVEACSTLGLPESIAENNGTGLFVYWNSNVCFVSTILRNNTQYGILSRYNSAMAAVGNVSLYGNAVSTNIASGSGLY